MRPAGLRESSKLRRGKTEEAARNSNSFAENLKSSIDARSSQWDKLALRFPCAKGGGEGQVAATYRIQLHIR